MAARSGRAHVLAPSPTGARAFGHFSDSPSRADVLARHPPSALRNPQAAPRPSARFRNHAPHTAQSDMLCNSLRIGPQSASLGGLSRDRICAPLRVECATGPRRSLLMSQRAASVKKSTAETAHWSVVYSSRGKIENCSPLVPAERLFAPVLVCAYPSCTINIRFDRSHHLYRHGSARDHRCGAGALAVRGHCALQALGHGSQLSVPYPHPGRASSSTAPPLTLDARRMPRSWVDRHGRISASATILLLFLLFISLDAGGAGGGRGE